MFKSQWVGILPILATPNNGTDWDFHIIEGHNASSTCTAFNVVAYHQHLGHVLNKDAASC